MKLILSAICLIAVQGMYAQQMLKSKSSFQFDVDVARYLGNDTAVYVELYYGIRENVFTYHVDSNRYVGGINMMVQVWRDSLLVTSREWSVPHVLTDTSQLQAGKTLVGIESFGLPPGKYRLRIIGYDVLDVQRRDSVAVSLPILLFSNDKPALSDIELSTSVAPSSNKESMFYKNTLEVLPNPSRLYGISLPFILYYVECYNLLAGGKGGGLIVRYIVTDANEKEVRRHDKKRGRTANSIVEVDKVNVSALKGGTYELQVTLLDSSEQLIASSRKKFFIYKPGTVAEQQSASPSADVLSSEYAVMSEAELDKEFAQARYISVDAERDRYEQLKDVASKRRFMFDFWRQRETLPDGEQGGFKAGYKNRLRYANEKYSLGIREGWKTDRGRVIILYGIPEEVERFPNSSQSNPYEVWHYHSLQGGVMFVFVDETGFGEYIQVHSTHRNEMKDENWFQHYAQKMQ